LAAAIWSNRIFVFKSSRYPGFASNSSTEPFVLSGLFPALLSRISSILLVTSGSAGAPSGVENLMPWYSGGLCDAVKFSPPTAVLLLMAKEIVGVGVGPLQASTRNPCRDPMSAATEANFSPMNRESCATIRAFPALVS
jgi:hypothetical protein